MSPSPLRVRDVAHARSRVGTGIRVRVGAGAGVGTGVPRVGKASRFPLIFAASVVALTLSGCSHDEEEARALVRAVDEFRAASNAEKTAREPAIANAVCHEAHVCEARDACAISSHATVSGLRLKAKVEQGLAAVTARDVSPDDPSARELPAELEQASRLLDEGYAALPLCDQKIVALRGKYRL